MTKVMQFNNKSDTFIQAKTMHHGLVESITLPAAGHSSPGILGESKVIEHSKYQHGCKARLMRRPGISL